MVAPIVLLMFLGLIEWGRFEMVRQVTSTAAFNAARSGAIPGLTPEDATNRASEVLSVYFVNGATVTTDITPEYSNVHISVPMNQNSLLLGKFFGSSTLDREFTVRAD